MKDKQAKNKVLIFIIFLIIVLSIIGHHMLYKKENITDNSDINKENNSDIKQEYNDNNITNNNDINYKYKMIKILDYYETEDNKNGTSITETDKYYILEYLNDYKSKIILYDKKGNNITTKKFGVDNIEYISSSSNDLNKSNTYIVRTSDQKYGLYDKDFNQVIKIDNHIIEATNNKKYFLVGKPIKESTMIENIEDVGIYDENGNIIIPREYERLFNVGMYQTTYEIDKTLFYARKNGKYGIIDNKNNIIIPFEYDRANSKYTLGLGEIFKSNGKYYYILYKNGKYGLVNESNKKVIEHEKDNLFYNKYANVVVEKIYNNSQVIKLNIYNLNGELKKEINLNNNIKVSFDAYYYKIGNTNLILYDNDYIYILNKELNYDKYIKPANVGYGMNTDMFLANNSIYLKEIKEKYKIYKVSDNSLYINEEYYYINNNYTKDSFILCKNKLEDNTYSECGIIDNDGNEILEFKYYSDYGTSLRSNTEYIDFEYNDKKEEYEIKKYQIKGNCTNDKEYFIRENIIKIDSNLYDLNCAKIATEVTNYDMISDNLLITEKFEDKPHDTYKIYDLNTKEIATIQNSDNATITNNIRSNLINNEPIIITNKGIYKIVKK